MALNVRAVVRARNLATDGALFKLIDSKDCEITIQMDLAGVGGYQDIPLVWKQEVAQYAVGFPAGNITIIP